MAHLQSAVCTYSVDVALLMSKQIPTIHSVVQHGPGRSYKQQLQRPFQPAKVFSGNVIIPNLKSCGL